VETQDSKNDKHEFEFQILIDDVEVRVIKMAYPGYAKILKKWDYQ